MKSNHLSRTCEMLSIHRAAMPIDFAQIGDARDRVAMPRLSRTHKASFVIASPHVIFDALNGR
jgi:hypothetical protein